MQKLIILFSILTLNTHTALPYQRGIQVKAITKAGQSIDLYSKSYALVIGISDYTEGWPVLPNAMNDAHEVGEELGKHGFTVSNLDNPTSAELKTAIETFVANFGQDPDNRLLFYFAGHGHTIKMNYGGNVGYIVPSDAPLPNRDRAGFLRKAVSMESFNTYARNIDAKHVLYLFDSCFSGSIFALSRAVPEAISYVTSQPVRQFITAGNENEQVPDKSIFKSQLIAAIRGEADNDKDGYITGTELGMFLQSKVVNYSRGAQHPQYGKIRDPRLDKGDFVFLIASTPDRTAAPDLPDDKPGIDLSKYKAESDRLGEVKKQWADWQLKMEGDFNKINTLDSDENLTTASKVKIWNEFLSTYTGNNPYSIEDEAILLKALDRRSYWRGISTWIISDESVFNQAAETGKNALIYFHADWAMQSHALDDRTWSNDSVHTALKQYIAVRLDLTKDNQKTQEYKNKYKISELPTFIILSSNGVELTRGEGFKSPEEVQKMLQEFKGSPTKKSEKRLSDISATPNRKSSMKGMVHVPSGAFKMGRDDWSIEEKPVHMVNLGEFYISPTEITVGEFRRFIEATGYRTDAEKSGGALVMTPSIGEVKEDGSWKNPYFDQTDDHPVTCVSWNDAVNYCNWRSEAEGLTPCYSGSGNTITCNFKANGYRLPTEAEWEYAARGGVNSKGYLFSGSDQVDDVCWYEKNANDKTHPVGQKKANEMGLYDMSGNVAEWCWDWYDQFYYRNSPDRDPVGPSSGESRVYRGGGWGNRPEILTCTYRCHMAPTFNYNELGFRCVRTY